MQSVGLESVFFNAFAKVISNIKFNIMLYEVGTDKMYNFNKGDISDADVPESIRSLLADSKMYCTYFSNGTEVMVLYFIRLIIEEDKYVVIIQDNKRHSRINRFIAELIKNSVILEGISPIDFHPVEVPSAVDSEQINLSGSSSSAPANTRNASEIHSSLTEGEIIDNLKGQVSGLQEKLAKVSDEMSGKLSVDVSSLKQEIINLKGELEQKNGFLKDKDAEIAGLDTLLKEKNDLIVKQQSELSKQEGGGDLSAESLKVQLNAALAKYEEDKKEWQEAAISGKQGAYPTIAASEVGELKVSTDRQMVPIGQDELSSLRETAAKLPLVQAHLDNARFEISDKNFLIQTLSKEIENLKAGKDSTELPAPVSGLDVSGSADELRQRLHILEDHSIKLQVKLSEKDQELRLLNDSNPAALKKLKNELDAAEAKVAELNAQYQALQKEKEQLKSDYFAIELEVKDLNAKISNKDLIIKESNEANLKQQEIVNQHKHKVDEIKAEMNTLSKELEDNRNIASECRKDLEDKELKFKAVLEENQKITEALNRDKAGLEKEISVLENNLRKYEGVADMLNLYIASIDSEGNTSVITEPKRDGFNAKTILEQKGTDDTCANTSYIDCLLDKVKKSKSTESANVVVDENGIERYYSISLYPMLDDSGEITDILAIIEDITHFEELSSSVVRFKEKLKNSKKARATDVNEISALQSSYLELAAQRDKLLDKNAKMLKIIEKLASTDSAKELLSARADLRESKSRLARSVETIKNYKNMIDDQMLKYSDLNKRTFLHLERLLNIIKAKTEFRGAELSTLLTFLTREFDSVRKNFIEIDKKSKENSEESSETSSSQPDVADKRQ